MSQRKKPASERERLKLLMADFAKLGLEHDGSTRKRKHCECHRAKTCFYCDGELSGWHEHDHFPLPFWAGGQFTVAACHSCHNSKDRVPIDRWPIEVFMAAWKELWAAGPNARLLTAMLFVEAATWFDRATDTAPDGGERVLAEDCAFCGAEFHPDLLETRCPEAPILIGSHNFFPHFGEEILEPEVAA